MTQVRTVRQQVEALQPPLMTCEAVIAEACFIVRHFEGGPGKVLDLVRRGLLSVPFHLDQEADAIEGLIERYSNVPISFADACLVRLSEIRPTAVVFTLDRDFLIYRKNRRQSIPTLMPPGSGKAPGRKAKSRRR